MSPLSTWILATDRAITKELESEAAEPTVQLLINSSLLNPLEMYHPLLLEAAAQVPIPIRTPPTLVLIRRTSPSSLKRGIAEEHQG